jgi:hypothetical protein
MSAQALATVGDGSYLAYSTDGTTFTNFANIESINGNKPKAAKIKTTKLIATANAETAQPGRVDYGEIVAKIRFLAATVALVNGWLTNKTILYFKTVVIDGATTDSSDMIQGFVMEFDAFGELQANKEIISTITIGTTGADTFTAGS